jgi:hypothetical protein
MVFDVPASHGCTVEDVRRAMFAFAAALSTGRGRLRGLFERVKRAVSPIAKEAHGQGSERTGGRSEAEDGERSEAVA